MAIWTTSSFHPVHANQRSISSDYLWFPKLAASVWSQGPVNEAPASIAARHRAIHQRLPICYHRSHYSTYQQREIRDLKKIPNVSISSAFFPTDISKGWSVYNEGWTCKLQTISHPNSHTWHSTCYNVAPVWCFIAAQWSLVTTM